MSNIQVQDPKQNSGCVSRVLLLLKLVVVSILFFFLRFSEFLIPAGIMVAGIYFHISALVYGGGAGLIVSLATDCELSAYITILGVGLLFLPGLWKLLGVPFLFTVLMHTYYSHIKTGRRGH